MKTTEKQAIAARLKEYCENKGSQNKAAATLKGVSPATLSQMLNGNWELITEEMWRNVAAQIGYDARQWIIVRTEGYNRMYKLLADAQENALVLAVTAMPGAGSRRRSNTTPVITATCSRCRARSIGTASSSSRSCCRRWVSRPRGARSPK